MERPRKRPRCYMDSWVNILKKHDSFADLIASDSLTTFHLEHRESGELSRHEGEERILILRSDRPGPIGKIVFSSDLHQSENEKQLTAHVFTHVLDVKEGFRGFDMGGLLVVEQLSFLKARFLHNPETTKCTQIVCQLEAEEDVRRHNKLISFYERHGYERTIGKKAQYLNNNDGETYRKIPMNLLIQGNPVLETIPVSMMKEGLSFIAVHVSSECSVDQTIHWGEMNSSECSNSQSKNILVAKRPDGWTQFYTSTGSPLSPGPQGNLTCSTCTEKWSCTCAPKFCFLSITGDSMMHSAPKNRFLIQSSQGLFLVLKSDQGLSLSEQPAFWRFEEKEKRLIFTGTTPQELIHSSRHFQTQTMEYVNQQREKYLSFRLARLSMDHALELAKSVNTEHCSSLFKKCIQTAELFRNDGQPDWVQLVGLLYYLGEIIPSLEKDTVDVLEQGYDWTVQSASWIVGCSFPRQHDRTEFLQLNADYRDHKCVHGDIYETRCGLDNALLTWSGQEYIYNFVKANRINMPSEGAKMLRLASLDSLLSNGAYSHIMNDNDRDVMFLISEFVNILNAPSVETDGLSEKHCEALWTGHYKRIAEKYGAAKNLKW